MANNHNASTSIDGNKGSKGAQFVTVYSKLPNGIFLQLSEEITVHEPIMGGGVREVRQGKKSGLRYSVPGTAQYIGLDAVDPKNVGKNKPLVFGYATLPNVPADFWETWSKQNADADCLVRGLVFAHAQVADGEAHAKENEKLTHGLEPIDQSKLPRGIVRADRSEAA